jgi:hypothetical protein
VDVVVEVAVAVVVGCCGGGGGFCKEGCWMEDGGAESVEEEEQRVREARHNESHQQQQQQHKLSLTLRLDVQVLFGQQQQLTNETTNEFESETNSRTRHNGGGRNLAPKRGTSCCFRGITGSLGVLKFGVRVMVGYGHIRQSRRSCVIQRFLRERLETGNCPLSPNLNVIICSNI